MTQTQYETGTWYGWNGGPCPVHPETVVEWLHVSKYGDSGPAGQLTWGFGDTGIAAFRIVTPYVEPEPKLECWMNVDADGSMFGYSTKEEADNNIYNDHIRCVRMIEADDR